MFGEPVPALDAESYTVTVSPSVPGCTTSTTSCVISGLSNSVAYTFTLVANNRIGTSSSVTASATPVPAPVLSVPGAPLTAVAVAGSRALTVSWTAPANDGGSAITSYTIELWSGSNTSGGTRLNSWPWSVANGTSVSITRLSRGSWYYVKVIAVNAIGAGAPKVSKTVKVL